jgi:biopolymer transport protein ExbD
MSSSTESAEGDVEFQIAPMIDLILVLLVFFMTTVAVKQVENELGIGLPGGQLDSNTTVEMKIAINSDGSVSLNSEDIANVSDKDLVKLRTKLSEQVQFFNDKVPVVISAEPDVLHHRVIDVLNACTAAKVKNVTFGS